MQSFTLQKQTLLKSPTPLTSQCLVHFSTPKHSLLLIAHKQSIKIYNLQLDRFQEQLKVGVDSGNVTAITVSDDLFFFAYGMHIAASGYNAKIIFDFDTYIASDKIDRIHVAGWKLWVICGGMINQFMLAGGQLSNKATRKNSTANKVEDIRSIMFQAKVNSSVCVEDQFSKHYLILLKNNNTVSIFQQKQLITHKTPSPPLCITPLKSTTSSTTTSSTCQYLIGTQSGTLLCVQIDKKSIKQLWKIADNGLGRINYVMIVKMDVMFVVRDKCVELWGSDHEMMASQELDEKYGSGVYVGDRALIVLGSLNGSVTQYKDYTQILKAFQTQTILQTKQSLLSQITKLTQQKQQLKQRISQQNTKNNTNISTINFQHLNADVNIGIQYGKCCNLIQIRSQCAILKVVGKGKGKVLQAGGRIVYEGVSQGTPKDKEGDQRVFVIEEEDKKVCEIAFRYPQQYFTNHKLQLIIFLLLQGKIYAVNRSIQLKLLGLHHKISPITMPPSSTLSITGQFKYFQINTFLNAIFPQFGQNGQSGDEWNQVYYESVIGKMPVQIRFRNGECYLQSPHPSPLLIVKQYILQKTKQKNLSINFSLTPNQSSIAPIVPTLMRQLLPLLQVQKQYNLLPGLYELQNDENLSSELKQILGRKDQIEKMYQEGQGKIGGLKLVVMGVYVGWRKMRDEDVTKYDVEVFEKLIEQADHEKLISKILQ